MKTVDEPLPDLYSLSTFSGYFYLHELCFLLHELYFLLHCLMLKLGHTPKRGDWADIPYELIQAHT